MAPIEGAVYATLLMNDSYLPGAMVLGHSVKDRGAKAPLVAFVTVEKVSQDTLTELRTVYDEVVPVQMIINSSPANLYLMNRPDLVSTFTKIELWKQTQYKRIVYLDADMVALRAPNELLTLDTQFAAVPDIGWPDCFNSGMLVLNPNMADYYSLLALARQGISFDGADQGLLNMHFKDWERLSFTYNCTPSGNYQYVPAYRHFQSSINLIHFIGRDKPWTLGRENKYNTGVYGELLARWWAVYDRHYRSQRAQYYSGQSFSGPKKVQDYVFGEEVVHAPGYSTVQTQQPPSVNVVPPADDPPVSFAPPPEQPLGDAPSPATQVIQQDFKPVPTVEQRRFSAPHIEWNPASAPPPANSAPEAANFPTTVYDMSSDTHLFQPPSKYPEAPKDMWYEVPEKVPEPPKPKHVFPWESRAPKATRVFAQPREPTPPPEPEPEPVIEDATVTPSGETDVSAPTEPSVSTPVMASPDPWSSFQARSNAWDDMPEIEKYVQAFTMARKGNIQVLHHTPLTGGVTSPTAETDRRPSMKLTDFPTEIERPSLPVTPAPIRRPSFWSEERDELGNLPAAEGVPKQEEWVRRFSSYPTPAFPKFAPPLQILQGVLHFTCQFCRKQNPVAKLEELQRRQSEVMTSPTKLEEAAAPPDRKMPESATKEAAIEAAMKAISPNERPKAPKPILKEPHFELEPKDESTDGTSAAPADGAETTEPAPDVKVPVFNPITIVGEAASESKTESSSTTAVAS